MIVLYEIMKMACECACSCVCMCVHACVLGRGWDREGEIKIHTAVLQGNLDLYANFLKFCSSKPL